MPLEFRSSGFNHPNDEHRVDYVIYSGNWDVGRIFEDRSSTDDLRWFWSITVGSQRTRAGHVATLEEAKAQFQQSWDAWKAWANLEETP